MSTHKIGIFPGCSLETSSSNYLISLKKVLDILDIHYTILQDWNCCGATSVKTLDHRLNQMLNLRNLALAEQQGIKQLVVPCASCYHRLASTKFELINDKGLLSHLSKQTGFSFKGTLHIKNLPEFLVEDIGVNKISQKVRHPFSKLSVVCYYGCLNTRIPGVKPLDDVEYPMSMDRILEATGVQTINWSYKTECCGASLFITSESISQKLVGKILKDARSRGADCVVVSCPLCQTNLDTKQRKIREKFSIDRVLPVPFISQLMGLTMGSEPEELGMNQNFERMDLLLEKIREQNHSRR